MKKTKLTSKAGLIISSVCLLLLTPGHARAISVTDDQGSTVVLDQPSRRIISLSPHITELLFAAGAGRKIVGVVRFSYYPEAAKTIPRVGDTNNLDLERIVSLNPDLIVAWQSNAAADTEILRELNIPVYVSEPESLEAIAGTITDLGVLSGTAETAKRASDAFIIRLSKLKRSYSHKPVVTTFYQFWDDPIFTVNGDHIISEVIQVCGGHNVFSEIPVLSTQINKEAVISTDPEVIIASGIDEKRPDWLDNWKNWPQLSAVKHNHLYVIPPDLIQRHTPRILDGAEMMCRFIDRVRGEKN